MARLREWTTNVLGFLLCVAIALLVIWVMASGPDRPAAPDDGPPDEGPMYRGPGRP